jgi:hypothetical protein
MGKIKSKITTMSKIKYQLSHCDVEGKGKLPQYDLKAATKRNEFAVNILEGAIRINIWKKGCGKTWTAVLKVSNQKHRS